MFGYCDTNLPSDSKVEDHTGSLPHEALSAFASLGTNGSHASNQERDLLRWMKGLWGFKLEPYTVMMDLQVSCFRTTFCDFFSPKSFELKTY